MKLIIRKGKTSRVIEAPFNIVGSLADLKNLAEQITAQIADEGFSYGTLYINDNVIQGTVNTEPSPWEEPEP